MSQPDALLTEIGAYLEKTGMARTAFGKFAINDFGLVTDLENGRDIKRSTERRIRTFMDKHPNGYSEQRPSSEAG